ncbi:MAG: hypothetical protein MHPSP_004165, partial [Paramarteilia canceri]
KESQLFLDLGLLSDKDFQILEADTYWVFSKFMSRIEMFYRPEKSITELNKQFEIIDNVISKVEPELLNHLNTYNVSLGSIIFRWFNNMLTREIPLPLIFKLWDAYL